MEELQLTRSERQKATIARKKEEQKKILHENPEFIAYMNDYRERLALMVKKGLAARKRMEDKAALRERAKKYRISKDGYLIELEAR